MEKCVDIEGDYIWKIAKLFHPKMLVRPENLDPTTYATVSIKHFLILEQNSLIITKDRNTYFNNIQTKRLLSVEHKRLFLFVILT
jgi:hypothetical protein